MVCPHSTQEEIHPVSHNTLQHTCIQLPLPQPFIPASFAPLLWLANHPSWPASMRTCSQANNRAS